jgi:hypothetical protein
MGTIIDGWNIRSGKKVSELMRNALVEYYRSRLAV